MCSASYCVHLVQLPLKRQKAAPPPNVMTGQTHNCTLPVSPPPAFLSSANSSAAICGHYPDDQNSNTGRLHLYWGCQTGFTKRCSFEASISHRLDYDQNTQLQADKEVESMKMWYYFFTVQFQWKTQPSLKPNLRPGGCPKLTGQLLCCMEHRATLESRLCICWAHDEL